MPQLIFTHPDFAGQSAVLSEGSTPFGRSPKNRLVIQHSSVSSDHGEFLLNGTELIIREHGSSNGTWVDGKRISGQAALRNGQTIRIGAVEARVELGIEDAPYEEKTEITAIHLHQRAIANPPVAVPPKAVTIHPASAVADSEQTVILPRPAAAASAPANSPATAGERPTSPSSNSLARNILVCIVVAAGLIIAWLALRSR